jgi:hypothetical protein
MGAAPMTPESVLGQNSEYEGSPIELGPGPGANRGFARTQENIFTAVQAKPDGVAFSIEPGDYKGMLSKNKYYIYYDPFFQKRAANVIIKVGSERKTGPQYGFYRVTGTDQQILDGIRSIRGVGTGNVFDDMIADIKEQIRDNKNDLEKLKSSIETARLSLQDPSRNGGQRGQIGQYLRTMQQQAAYKDRVLGELERSLASFEAAKVKEAKTTAEAAY